jgi:Ser/Thr protein kinase RdoA (MazF antagonist)
MAIATHPTCWWTAQRRRCAASWIEPAVAMSELLTEGVAPLGAIGAVLSGFAQGQRVCSEEVELLFDIVTARHAVTLLVHAWRAHHDPQGPQVLDAAAAHAERSLQLLLSGGRAALTDAWHEAASLSTRSPR